MIMNRRSLRRLPTQEEQINKRVFEYPIAAVGGVFEAFEELKLLPVRRHSLKESLDLAP
jgi:hypothetical protein